MRSRIIRAALAVATGLVLAACSTTAMHSAEEAGWSRFGAAGKTSGTTVALGALQGGERNVIVEGTIIEVCAEKGCWMRVQDGEDEVFVRFKDYAFFVPRNAAGHRVVLHGTAKLEQMSVAELRHYAEDAGASPEEVAAITQPRERVTLYADSVYIEGEDLDAPYNS